MKANSSACNTPNKVIPANTSTTKLITTSETKKDNHRNVQRDLFPTTPVAIASSFDKRGSNSFCHNTTDFVDLNNSFNKKSFDRCSTPLRSTADCNSNSSITTTTRTPIRSFEDRNNTSHNSTNNNTSNNSFCLADYVVSNKSKQNKRRSRNQSTNNNNNNNNNNSTSNYSNASSTPNTSGKANESGSATVATSVAEVATTIKPKRRVVPTTIQPNSGGKSNQSAGQEFFTSSFKSDNNLLHVMSEEKELNSNHMHAERETLLEEKLNIKQEFELQNERKPINCIQQINRIFEKSTLNASPSDKPALKLKINSGPINLTNIANKVYLDNLIKIYSHIIDLNLVTNILNELSYLFNLININIDSTESRAASIVTSSNNCNVDYKYNLLLKTVNNCIYFSFGVLERQKCTLSLLDTKTLKVLIENERMASLNANLYGYMKKIYKIKINLNYNSIEQNISNASNVFYQEETDTRINYPSENEFRSFIKQRDLFYTVLRKWEYQYSNPKANINIRLNQRVVELITILDQPVNMHHLAKLFVAQLILSCNFDDTLPELQNELPNIDLNKLSKLQQRLVAPSYFSTEYTFPGIQGFFKEFILHGLFSNVFMEQLKSALINELLLMTEDLSQEERFEDTIRPINISTMRVLAKFIGYIVSLPYKYDNRGNLGVDETQIKYRNMTLPQFDIRTVLIKSIKENRILITIPWIVQYLTMLDHISIQLNYYKSVLKILYELYIQINQIAKNYHPTSKFIIQACLGWLFQEIPSISDDYYTYHTSLTLENGIKLAGHDNSTKNWELIEIIIPSKLQSLFVKSSLPVEMTNFEIKNDRITCTINNHNNINPLVVYKPINLDVTKAESLNVNLESLLNIACPFLADFRISIMPTNYTKTVSRSGNYRYIRTNLSDPNPLGSTENSANSSKQQKLLDEFLQSQSQSTKKTIDFIIERTISAVIKDYQIEFLLPIKNKTTTTINSITDGNSSTEVKKNMLKIYTNGLKELAQCWQENLPHMIRERVTNSFNALLPKETLDVLKKTYIAFAVQKCLLKTNEWKSTHCSSIQFFTKDLKADAEKLYQKIKSHPKTSESIMGLMPGTDMCLSLHKESPIPSEVYTNLQVQLYRVSRAPELVVYDDLIQLLNELSTCMTQQILTPDLYKTTGFLVIQLITLIICNLPVAFDENLVKQFIDFLKHEKFEPFLKYDIESDDDDVELRQQHTVRNCDDEGIDTLPKKNTNYLFNAFLSGCLLELIKNSTSISWHLLEKFIITLIDSNFYSLNLFNEQYLSLFKYELSASQLDNLSKLMDGILKHFNKTAQSCDFGLQHDQLFSEMLTDLTREIDNL